MLLIDFANGLGKKFNPCLGDIWPFSIMLAKRNELYKMLSGKRAAEPTTKDELEALVSL